jgi:alpha-tubulin suppressor-like RCC1 family protein
MDSEVLSRGNGMEDGKSKKFEDYDCNLIVWGSWKSVYKDPIELNFIVQGSEGEKPKPLERCIVELISIQDCCVFITEDGSLYSMGQSVRGLLGLGPDVVSTGGHVVKIKLPSEDSVRVVDIKAGTNHLLALTDDGQVYAWGMNKQG